MKVWRIQSLKDGKGPFFSVDSDYLFDFVDHADLADAACLGNDAWKLINKQWVCSWRTRELLMRFPANRATVMDMAQCDFVVVCLEVVDYMIGKDDQVVFDPKTSVVVETISIEEFFS